MKVYDAMKPYDAMGKTREQVREYIRQHGACMDGFVERVFGNGGQNGWRAGIVRVPGKSTFKFSGTVKNAERFGKDCKITMHGCMVDDGYYTPQFKCDWIRVCTEDKRSLIAYLSGPSFPGIGVGCAEKLYAVYQGNAIDRILSDPKQVQADCSLTDRQIDTLSRVLSKSDWKTRVWRQFLHMTDKDIEFVKAVQGEDGFDYIRRSPYLLLDLRIKDSLRANMEEAKQFENYRIPFKRVDEIARFDCGIRLDEPVRIEQILLKAMKAVQRKRRVTYLVWDESVSGGMDDIYDLMREMNQPEHPLPDGYDVHALHRFLLNDGKRGFYKIHCPDVGPYHYRLYLSVIHDAQMNLVRKLKSSFALPTMKRELLSLYQWIGRAAASGRWILTPEQEKGLSMVFSHSVSVVSGGPGRGKTYWAGALLDAWTSLVSNHVIALGPTGRSVNKLKADTGWEDCQTAARFLLRQRLASDATMYQNVHTGDTFHLDARTLVIIDEASMFDMMEVERLMDYLYGCTIVFLGDVNQLPPIEVGEFLSELVHANQNGGNYPFTYFVQCKRTNHRGIVDNCDRIANGMFSVRNCICPEFMVECHYRNPANIKTKADVPMERYAVLERIKGSAIRHYQSMVRQYGEKDVLLLTPVKNERYVTGSISLNKAIQSQMNPVQTNFQWIYDSKRKREFVEVKGYVVPGFFIDGMAIRLYDRVMNTKNEAEMKCYYHKDDNPDKAVVSDSSGIYNGDAGRILRYYKAKDQNGNPEVMIQLDDGRVLFRDAESLKHWTFGYAITVHKAQGSEASAVLFVCSDECSFIPNFLNRNLLYTAATRAKEEVFLLGDEDTIQGCADRMRVRDRSTLGMDLI